MNRYEVKTETIKYCTKTLDGMIEKYLNSGWEVVSTAVVYGYGIGAPKHFFVTFKRNVTSIYNDD